MLLKATRICVMVIPIAGVVPVSMVVLEIMHVRWRNERGQSPSLLEERRLISVLRMGGQACGISWSHCPTATEVGWHLRINTHRTRRATRLVEFECVRLAGCACGIRSFYRMCILMAPLISGDLLAQLVEHRIPEILKKRKRILPKVGGSSPP